MNKKYLSAFAVLIVLIGLGASQVASAQTSTQTPSSKISGERKGHGISGTVVSVSGTTITITAKQFKRPNAVTSTATSAPTTYTIDATNATVMKNGVASSLSAIVAGDKIMITGTKNGTNIIATKINDGMGLNKENGILGENRSKNMQNLPAGNGQPIVGGTISSVTGTSITITNSTGTTYTIDASNAKINKGGITTPTISDVVVGDIIIAQGSINGSSVTANSVIDRGPAPSPTSTQTQTQTTSSVNNHSGFFGSVGGFFKHMFGF